jgi:hypothetical protein
VIPVESDFIISASILKIFGAKVAKIIQYNIILVPHPYDPAMEYYNPCKELWGDILAKAPFDVCLNAHTHRFAYYPKGQLGNNFPVVTGGGDTMDTATVMILQKKGKNMTLRVLNTKGEEKVFRLK